MKIFFYKKRIIAIVFALTFGYSLYLLGIYVGEKNEKQRNEIRLLYNELRKCLLEDDEIAGNKLFTPAFQAIPSYPKYILDRFGMLKRPDYVLSQNCYIAISSNTAELCPDSTNGRPSGIGLYLLKIGDKWYFTGQTIMYTN